MRTLRAALALSLLAGAYVSAATVLLVQQVLPGRRSRTTADPGGLVLTEQDQPALWAEVRQLAAAVGTRSPDEIRLVPEVNAAVSEETSLLGLRAGTRRMFLGVPLLQGLSRSQLQAVLAHELGHHSTTLSGLGALVHRSRLAIAEVAAGLASPLAKRPFRTYARLFFALTRPLAHSHEVDADRLSAKVAGPRTAAVALRTLPALDAAWRIYLEQYVEPGTHYGLRPTRFFDSFTHLMSDPERLEELARISAAPPETTASAYDSHPPLSERIERLEAMASADETDKSGNAASILRYPSQCFLALEDKTFAGSGLTPAPMAEIVSVAGARAAAVDAEILLNAMRENQIVPATVRGALDLIASGNLDILLGLVEVESTTAEDAGNTAGETRRRVIARLLGAAIAHELVGEDKARYELSWAGPWRLVDIAGQEVDPENLAYEALDAPGYAAALRAWVYQLDAEADTERRARATDPRAQPPMPDGYIGALAPVSGDGFRTLLATDAGLMLLKPSGSDRLATGLATVASGSPGRKLIQRALDRSPAELAATPHAAFVPWDRIRALHLKHGSNGRRTADITTAAGDGWSLHWTDSAEAEGHLWPAVDHYLGRRFTVD
ncbi:M48 family metallopeptidase [Nocardioides panzhihuensis]|uniref:Zn-dependent protease with chaperone function n=1 Tax=Nocardioides panzhihuensis TaxID=860243 RepID=A0A7Z0DID0_9ACTN|nr:M48 family metallopeptidase [Nocardioides panzhihuensis]NYI76150.1 Zn-dependent protease with chaperone function [Nocardioides panzhihuensis]